MIEQVIEQWRWARRRIGTALRPGVEVTEPPEMHIDWDVPVVVRDGTTLRVNVFRPLGTTRSRRSCPPIPMGRTASRPRRGAATA